MSREKKHVITGTLARSIAASIFIFMMLREITETYFRIRSWSDQVGKSEVSKTYYLAPEKVNATFKDLIGFEQTKAELKSTLEWSLKYGHLAKIYDLHPVRGICLFGPPGCGKTHFARCVAGELGVNLYLVTPSIIGSKWYGETEKRIRRLFEEAMKNSPSMIAIDETDKLLIRRSSSSTHLRILSEFLQNMDGLLSKGSPVVVIFMTNEPWQLHEAIMRRGRVDRLIYVPPPDFETRLKLFMYYMSKISENVKDNIDYEELARATEPSERGLYSSAAIKEICRTAKEEAFKSAVSSNRKIKISMDHFYSALLKVPPDIDIELVRKYEKWMAGRISYVSS